MPYCTRCDALVADGASNCPNCGASIASAGPVDIRPYAAAEATPPGPPPGAGCPPSPGPGYPPPTGYGAAPAYVGTAPQPPGRAPVFGILSSLLSSAGVVLLVVLYPIGAAGESGDTTGFTLFLGALLLSFLLVVAGVVLGVIGLFQPRKLLAIAGLVIAPLWFVILAIIFVLTGLD